MTQENNIEERRAHSIARTEVGSLFYDVAREADEHGKRPAVGEELRKAGNQFLQKAIRFAREKGLHP